MKTSEGNSVHDLTSEVLLESFTSESTAAIEKDLSSSNNMGKVTSSVIDLEPSSTLAFQKDYAYFKAGTFVNKIFSRFNKT